MKKRMITNLLLCAICTTALSQNLDRVFLGFHEIQSYPYCPMDTMVKTYAVVTDHFVPIAYKGPTYFIEDALAVNCRYRKEVASPDGADLVVSVNDYFEKESSIQLVKYGDRHLSPRRTHRHFAHELLVKIGVTDKSSLPAPPKPKPGAKGYLALATKEVGFSIDVSTKGGVVFTDTVYYLVDFESEILPDRESAEDDLRKQLSSFTLYGELKNYSPFLIKVIASKPIDVLRLHIYRVKNKKKCEIDYSDINNAASSFEKAYDYLKKRPQEIEHFRKITSSALKVWRDNIARKDEQNGKVNEQVLASLYYNIAVYYTLVRDYQTASEYFRLSDQTVVGFADALRLSTLSNTWGNAQEAYRKRME